jgi:hypothetical protein
MLIDLGKVFGGLIANYASRSKKIRVFITLGARSNNKMSARANTISSGTNFHPCLYKKTNSEKKH